MLSEDYSNKTEITRKALVTLKKDIAYRDEAILRNEPTYTLDAEIKGQFIQIEEYLQQLANMYQNFEKKATELNLRQRDLDKRKLALDNHTEERNRLKRIYDQSLARRVPNTRAAQQAENKEQFEKKYEGQKMTKEQLLALKEEQEKKQDDALDGLIGTVRQMKAGHGAINQELKDHDNMLNVLQGQMDDNIEDMSKIRRKLTKLLESSSYCCLIIIIILEIAGIICNLVLWPKHSI